MKYTVNQIAAILNTRMHILRPTSKKLSEQHIRHHTGSVQKQSKDEFTADPNTPERKKRLQGFTHRSRTVMTVFTLFYRNYKDAAAQKQGAQTVVYYIAKKQQHLSGIGFLLETSDRLYVRQVQRLYSYLNTEQNMANY